ncbi:MAG: SMI1/KNR4 family protein [Candidatus Brevundimonas phytovorans]|nr:SMI1/KNR4 family protein [Brevundimonas sp.]WEK59331.1 MAG: SMI1/KNR4 family protein [Brevundimonas sp.]
MRALADFSSKWSHPEYPPVRVLVADLKRAEDQLDSRLPSDYRDAVLSIGLPRPTTALLHSICEEEADFSDVAEFLAADEMVETTQAWRQMGLPKDKIAFASDCMGNLFVFDSGGLSQNSQVWFFDHDSGEIALLAASFDSWLQRYLDLKFVSLDD